MREGRGISGFVAARLVAHVIVHIEKFNLTIEQSENLLIFIGLIRDLTILLAIRPSESNATLDCRTRSSHGKS